MGEIHELFVLALSLVWFAGATPELSKLKGPQRCEGFTMHRPSGSHPRIRLALSSSGVDLSRPDSCSVDFGRETPKFRFEICRGFFGGFFPPVLSKEKGPKKSTEKSPAKFTWDFVRENSPRISAEAFSWRFGIDSTSISWFDPISMPNRPLRRGGRGGFEGEVRGACA